MKKILRGISRNFSSIFFLQNLCFHFKCLELSLWIFLINALSNFESQISSNKFCKQSSSPVIVYLCVVLQMVKVSNTLQSTSYVAFFLFITIIYEHIESAWSVYLVYNKILCQKEGIFFTLHYMSTNKNSIFVYITTSGL